MAGRPRTQARLARLGLADDGGRAHARAYRVCCAFLHRHTHACLRLLDGCHSCQCRSWFRRCRAGRNHRHALSIVGAAFIAGHGVRDPRVLFALRPRSHPHVSCLRAKSLRGAYGPNCHGRGGDCSAVGCAIRQRLGGARRRPMAWSLWCGHCDGRGGYGRGIGADDRFVPHHWCETHTPDCPDCCGRDRGRFRHRAAGCRDIIRGQALALRGAAVGLDAAARA